jgi:3-dehydroquinate dehydratase-2
MIINGPNLDLLGSREPEIYGSLTLEDINKGLESTANQLGMELIFHQSNLEGRIVELLHEAGQHCRGVVINPGGYSHTSVAILDAIKSISIPVVEVHLSNLHKREKFRRRSLTASGAAGIISGFGQLGYHLALRALSEMI